MISISDIQTMRAVLDRTPTDFREDRAIANIFFTLIPPNEPRPTPALVRFDSLTGPEKIRDCSTAFGWCRSASIEGFSVDQLIQIRRMWLASEWDFFPDQWTSRQLLEALAGKPPRWDDKERPVYE